MARWCDHEYEVLAFKEVKKTTTYPVADSRGNITHKTYDYTILEPVKECTECRSQRPLSQREKDWMTENRVLEKLFR